MSVYETMSKSKEEINLCIECKRERCYLDNRTTCPIINGHNRLKKKRAYNTPIRMIEKDSGKVVKEFESISAAVKYFGKKSLKGGIYKCVCGSQRSANGYKWVYAE